MIFLIFQWTPPNFPRVAVVERLIFPQLALDFRHCARINTSKNSEKSRIKHSLILSIHSRKTSNHSLIPLFSSIHSCRMAASNNHSKKYFSKNFLDRVLAKIYLVTVNDKVKQKVEKITYVSIMIDNIRHLFG